MQARKIGKRRFVLVLSRGEELVGTVTAFLEEQGIRGGFLFGLGALSGPTLAYFDPAEGEYRKRTFEEDMELGSLVGSVGTVDGRPFLHAHATVCGPELVAFTGHLVEGKAGATVEILLTVFDEELPRVKDEETGLNLLRVEEDGGETGGEEG